MNNKLKFFKVIHMRDFQHNSQTAQYANRFVIKEPLLRGVGSRTDSAQRDGTFKKQAKMPLFSGEGSCYNNPIINDTPEFLKEVIRFQIG